MPVIEVVFCLHLSIYLDLFWKGC